MYRLYNKWRHDNFTDKTMLIVETAKEYTNEDFHILTNIYTTVNGQIIGSELSTLIYKACKEPENYIRNRFYYLKDIAETIKRENTYTELFEFIKNYHKRGIQMLRISFQIQQEIGEIIGLITPFNTSLVGLDNGNPIFTPSKFPYTSYFLGKINNLPPINKWNKKHHEIMHQNYARSNINNYMYLTFGFYDNNCLDLVPQNSVNLKWFKNDIKLPRMLFEVEELIDIIKENKKYVMNKNGVVVDCYNAGDIETIIFYENRGMLLYKVIFTVKGWIGNDKGRLVNDVNGGEFTGIIALDNFRKDNEEIGQIYSILSSIDVYIEKSYNIESFVLECYADIVCGKGYAKSNNLDNSSEILYNSNLDDNDIENYFKEQNRVGIRYTPLSMYNEGVKNSARSSKKTREKYYVTGHLRKLPTGATTSYEAKQNALEYGIDIPEGYTFVRPHYSGLESIRTHYTKVVEE
jgi:hypothetical protein